MVTSVSSLLKTVRSVEDEASRGVRAIESTVDAVKQAVLVRNFLFIILYKASKNFNFCFSYRHLESLQTKLISNFFFSTLELANR